MPLPLALPLLSSLAGPTLGAATAYLLGKQLANKDFQETLRQVGGAENFQKTIGMVADPIQNVLKAVLFPGRDVTAGPMDQQAPRLPQSTTLPRQIADMPMVTTMPQITFRPQGKFTSPLASGESVVPSRYENPDVIRPPFNPILRAEVSQPQGGEIAPTPTEGKVIEMSKLPVEEQIKLTEQGKKPLTLTAPNQKSDLPFIDFKTKSLSRKGDIVTEVKDVQQRIYFREENRANAEKLKAILINAFAKNENVKVGDVFPHKQFSAKVHTEIGQLLGYSSKEINDFLIKNKLSTPTEGIEN